LRAPEKQQHAQHSDGNTDLESVWLLRLAQEKHDENQRLRAELSAARRLLDLGKRQHQHQDQVQERRWHVCAESLWHAQLQAERWRQRADLFRDRAARLERQQREQRGGAHGLPAQAIDPVTVQPVADAPSADGSVAEALMMQHRRQLNSYRVNGVQPLLNMVYEASSLAGQQIPSDGHQRARLQMEKFLA
jgi:hypothetical protein